MRTNLHYESSKKMSFRTLTAGLCMLALLLAGCTAETDKTDRSSGEDTDSGSRREVLLAFKNKLSVSTTKAGTKTETKAIATGNENEISTLDIYVFAAKEENGTYTFRERFSYRQDGSPLPAGARELNLTPSTDNATTTALLELQKGLFVRLYSIANQTELVNPVDGNPVTDAYFDPLAYDMETGVLNDGTPTEEQFRKFYSPLLTDASPALGLPLPMVGAQIVPIDLTDLGSSSRVQVGFKLTRTMARFDVTNVEKESRFHLETISMAKGRAGVSFFPVKVYGDPVAKDGELITYPARTFEGDNANTGTQESAFYSYPSLLADEAYLVLAGTYRVNETESKKVTYQVPFKQETAGGGSSFLEINPNHRYTIGITKADEYHLDFTLEVADWTDGDLVDGYDPSKGSGLFDVNIDVVNGDYDPDTRIVNMAITDGAAFSVAVASNSAMDYSLTYEKKVTTAPWLTVTPLVVRSATQKFAYTVSRNADYTGNDFPVAYLRFIDKATNNESLLIIHPIAIPVVKLVSASSECAFDKDNGTITLYKDETSGKTSVTLNIVSTGGCTLEDVSGGNLPDWLERDKDALTDAAGNIKLTLNTDDPSFPSTLPVDGYTFYVVNAKNNDKKLPLTVRVKTAINVRQSAVTVSNGGNYDATNSRLRLYNNTSDKVTLTVFSLKGSDMEGVPAWLTLDKTTSSNDIETYTFHVEDGAATGSNATITVKNKFDNTLSETFTVYSINKNIVFSEFTASQPSYSTVDNLSNPSPNITFFPSANAYFTVKVVSPKGVDVTCHDNWRWIAKPTATETTDLNTGAVTAIYRFTRSTNPGGRNADEFFATASADEKITFTNNYAAGDNKGFAIKHSTPVYPGSTTAPKIVTGSSKSYWVSPVSQGAVPFANKSCPSGWKVGSIDDYKNMMYIPSVDLSAEINKTRSYENAQAKKNGEIMREGGVPYIWASEAYWYMRFDADTYRGNSIGNNDTNGVRCIQQR